MGNPNTPNHIVGGPDTYSAPEPLNPEAAQQLGNTAMLGAETGYLAEKLLEEIDGNQATAGWNSAI